MDILIALIGKPGSGQDDVADIGIAKFNCTGKVALVDWQKKVLSNEFHVLLEDFSGDGVVFRTPIILKPSNLRTLVMRLGEYGFIGGNRISTGKWVGRLIENTNDLLKWFTQEVVLESCGNKFVSKVAKDRGLAAIPRKTDQNYNLLFITDVENDDQLDVLKQGSPLFFVVSVDKTAANPLAFDSIINDGSLVDLEVKVRDLLISIREEVKRVRSNQPA